MERRPLSEHPGIRALCVIAAVGGFLAVASVISPSSTTAMTSGGRPATTNELPSLGQLHGARYTVEMFAGPDGVPLYTVTDDDGTVLVRQVPKEDLYQIDPDLDPDTWIATQHADVDIDDDF
jgi:hypothetical protein